MAILENINFRFSGDFFWEKKGMFDRIYVIILQKKIRHQILLLIGSDV
jgi:hypothetical protein